MALLEEPPVLTWAVHLALLEAPLKLGLPVSHLRRLAEVDDLHVQAALAELELAGR